MYKLLAIDLDGTLLNEYGEVSQANYIAIQKAKEKGVKVILTSGRAVKSVQNLAEELESNENIICGNGAIIYNINEKKVLYNKFISKRKILQIAKICEENSIYYNVYTPNGIIAKTLNYNLLFYNHENTKKTEANKTRINIVQDIYKYIEEKEDEEYLKINIADSDKIIFDNIIKKLKQIKDIEVLDVSHMSRKFIEHGQEIVPVTYYYTEISSSDVSKWNALEYIMNLYGINKDEVIAIGDNVNDISMVENAGVGVIVGNGAPYIKEKADLVVAPNNENGVAEAIEKLILSE